MSTELIHGDRWHTVRATGGGQHTAWCQAVHSIPKQVLPLLADPSSGLQILLRQLGADLGHHVGRQALPVRLAPFQEMPDACCMP